MTIDADAFYTDYELDEIIERDLVIERRPSHAVTVALIIAVAVVISSGMIATAIVLAGYGW